MIGYTCSSSILLTHSNLHWSVSHNTNSFLLVYFGHVLPLRRRRQRSTIHNEWTQEQAHQDAVTMLELIIRVGQPSLLASGSEDSTIKIWNLDSRELLQAFGQPGAGVCWLAWIPSIFAGGEEEGWLATGLGDHTVVVYSLVNHSGELAKNTRRCMCSPRARGGSPRLAVAGHEMMVGQWLGRCNSSHVAT